MCWSALHRGATSPQRADKQRTHLERPETLLYRDRVEAWPSFCPELHPQFAPVQPGAWRRHQRPQPIAEGSAARPGASPISCRRRLEEMIKQTHERWKNSRSHAPCRLGFLTVGAEVFIGAVRAVLFPIAGISDVDTAAVVTLELVAGAATCAHWAERQTWRLVPANLDKHIISFGIFSSD